MQTITDSIQALWREIHQLAQENQRDPSTITLIAVSKTQPVAALQAAITAGQTHFGENYIKEALGKIEALRQYPLTWHFIGPIQSNKTHEIATHFDWVHSVDRKKIAQRLNDQRPAEKGKLNVCIEVNLGEEPQKAGVSLEKLPELARFITGLPQLKLRGLMAIPPQQGDYLTQRYYFKQLRLAFDALIALGYHLDTLSMGMSQDFPAAIAEGATFLRIGTALFGHRKKV